MARVKQKRPILQGRILPDRLTSGEHAQHLQFAERMLDVYRTGIGRRRRDLHRDVHRIFEVDCPLRRIDGFCKLLDDQSKYADAGRREAPKFRRQVFRIAARHHPLMHTISSNGEATYHIRPTGQHPCCGRRGGTEF